MNFIYKVGDLMEAEEPAIAHGCNIRGVMGAGVAKLVRDRHPEVFYAYDAACDTGRFRPGAAQAVYSSPAGSPGRWFYNLGTQKNPGPDAKTWWIFLAFANMAEDAAIRGIDQVAIPRIGCGIGGLVWPEVEEVIRTAVELSSSPNLDIVVYDLETP